MTTKESYNVRLIDGVHNLHVGYDQTHIRLITDDLYKVIKCIESGFADNNPVKSELSICFSPESPHLIDLASANWTDIESVDQISEIIEHLASYIRTTYRELMEHKCMSVEAYFDKYGTESKLNKKVFVFAGMNKILHKALSEDKTFRRNMSHILKLGRAVGVHFIMIDTLEEGKTENRFDGLITKSFTFTFKQEA